MDPGLCILSSAAVEDGLLTSCVQCELNQTLFAFEDANKSPDVGMMAGHAALHFTVPASQHCWFLASLWQPVSLHFCSTVASKSSDVCVFEGINHIGDPEGKTTSRG